MTSALVTASCEASASTERPPGGSSRNSARSFFSTRLLRSSLRLARALRRASVAARPPAGPSSPPFPLLPLSPRPPGRPRSGAPRPGAGAPKRPPAPARGLSPSSGRVGRSASGRKGMPPGLTKLPLASRAKRPNSRGAAGDASAVGASSGAGRELNSRCGGAEGAGAVADGCASSSLVRRLTKTREVCVSASPLAVAQLALRRRAAGLQQCAASAGAAKALAILPCDRRRRLAIRTRPHANGTG